MRIVVCMKQVPDPEAPASCFEINPRTLRVEPRGIPPVLSLFDENALEAALQLKDRRGGDVRITVLSVGRKLSNAVLQKALAAGADELIKVQDEAFDSSLLDSYAAAAVLAAAIRKIGDYDLVLTGRQAADWNAGQVGIGIATILNLPVITLARRVDVENGRVLVERVIPRGFEVIRTSLPAVVVASNEVGGMRYPTMLGRRKAKEKPTEEWGAADVGYAAPQENRLVLKRLFAPELRKGRGLRIEGATPEETGRKLAQRLKEDGIL